MQNKIKKTKRITLRTLLIRSLCLSAAASLAFAIGFRKYLVQSIHQQSQQQIGALLSRMQSKISSFAPDSENGSTMGDIQSFMTTYGYYDIPVSEPLALTGSGSGSIHLTSGYTPGCHAAAALLNAENEIVASNRETLSVYLKLTEEDNGGFYVCADVPQADQLYTDYRELLEDKETERYVRMQMDSAYINKKDGTFIPHEGTMTAFHVFDGDEPLISINEREAEASKEIQIEINDDAFKLVELHPGSNADTPRYMLFGFSGEKAEDFDKFKETLRDADASLSSTFHHNDDGTRTYCAAAPIYIGQRSHFLSVCFQVNFQAPELTALFWQRTLLFTLAAAGIALLWSWRKNTLNKAKYAFDDYQKDLTNSLAHDLKTPLMAIGGYTENLMDIELSKEEKDRYLAAILENVAYMDSLISRTLLLNKTNENAKIKRQPILAEAAVDAAFKKYEPMLDEKNITLSVQGSASIYGDPASFEMIVENLVSNAVKYTAENGSIKIRICPKRLVIVNTVSERINTSDLKRPFVRGDSARSNKAGSGLGLSLAERAALANGFSLTLSCTDKEFQTELIF